MQYLKQSTIVTLKIGPFLDETDGKTAETGLTIAQADVRLSKNGGDIAQKTEATSCTHDELGIYGCPIDATDTATLGRLQLFVHESGALPVFCEYLVVTANIYDTLCSTDKFDVNVTHIADTSQTANDNGADINDILTDTGTTLDTLIKDIPTTAEIALRTLLAADYVVVGDTIAGVTLATTCTTNTDMVTEPPTVAEVRIEMDASSTKLASIETDTKGISDTACSADGASPTTNSLADIARKMKWFVANLWEIDENATPDTFKIFKDDNTTVGLNFTVYTDSSKSYRDNTP